ncbi:PIN domain-containing protein [Microlunatus sp. GCM10028923]|uniref:PIN domain-containing protein n=1 Tax=Microlunatus sp. GCM10028923 TaxID=3273400 RepID=UPI00361E41E3
MFAAILDSCVLWPSVQRDFLLSLAAENLYRPLWSEAILIEVEINEEEKRLERGEPKKDARDAAQHLMDQMAGHFDDAIVGGWEHLEGTFGLPDPDDEHVVAAAVVGGAGAIVTVNLKDFPSTLVPPQIQVIHVRDFAADTADINPRLAARAFVEMSHRRTLPPTLSAHELLDLCVERYEMVEVEQLVRPFIDAAERAGTGC